MSDYIEFTSIAVPKPAKPVVRTVALRRALTRAFEDCAQGQQIRVQGRVCRLLETPSEHGVMAGRITYAARVWLAGEARESVVVVPARAAALVLEA